MRHSLNPLYSPLTVTYTSYIRALLKVNTCTSDTSLFSRWPLFIRITSLISTSSRQLRLDIGANIVSHQRPAPGYPLNPPNLDTWTETTTNPNPLATQVFTTCKIQSGTQRKSTCRIFTDGLICGPLQASLRYGGKLTQINWLLHTYTGGIRMNKAPSTEALTRIINILHHSNRVSICKYIFIYFVV